MTPFNLKTLLDPFAVLVHHGIDDVDERLVTVEKPVSTGENISFKPALGCD